MSYRIQMFFPAILVAVVAMPTGLCAAAAEPEPSGGATIRVGQESGDYRGDDNRAIQAAIEYVAVLGGGTVEIGPGVYEMRNALVLRDNVRIVGVPGETILKACKGENIPLVMDGDCNQREITVADGSLLRVGDGVVVSDERFSRGFTVTTATLTERLDANTFRISRPLYLDYMVRNNATAQLAFPVVGGWHVSNCSIEGITVDGNRDNAEYLDGCRGGGIYLFECENVSIRNCVAENYNGDGISFQVSQNVVVENCIARNNAGLGLHPGSGSQHPVVRKNVSFKNGRDGLYVCWRVKHGIFEDNQLMGNQRSGISIGHKDTDNLFRRNVITKNRYTGILFRNESQPMGAHRNRFEQNEILDNGHESGASIVMQGHHHDVVFRDNVIGYSSAPEQELIGIRHSTFSDGLDAEQNDFANVKAKIEEESSK